MDRERSFARLGPVLKTLDMYKREYQLDLAESAICWAFSELAAHPRRKDAESNFLAHVDLMYVDSEDANMTLSEADRQQLLLASDVVISESVSSIGSILAESARALITLESENLYRRTADLLHRIRIDFLDHASASLLADLTMKLLLLNLELEGNRLGVSRTQLWKAFSDTVESGAALQRAVFDSVNRGLLEVRDGKIVVAGTVRTSRQG